MVSTYSSPGRLLETLGAWLLGLLWMLPLLYAAWTALHPAIYATLVAILLGFRMIASLLRSRWHRQPVQARA